MEIADCITATCQKCATGAVWRKLYAGINAVLDSMTLQSMLDDHSEVGVCKCNTADRERDCRCREECRCEAV